MCGYAEASLALSVLGTGMQLFGQSGSNRAASNQNAYLAGVARNNAILAERAAKDAEDRGKIAAQDRATQTAQLKGRQRAVLAGQGVEVDTGSALDLTTDTAEIGKRDELTIRSNAEREALGFRTQGMNYQASANLYDAAGRNTSGGFGFASTLISGAGSVAQKWYEFDKAGAFGSSSGGGYIPTSGHSAWS
jgi:hypothetical protein